MFCTILYLSHVLCHLGRDESRAGAFREKGDQRNEKNNIRRIAFTVLNNPQVQCKPSPTHDRPTSLWLTSLLMMTQSFLTCRRSGREAGLVLGANLLTTPLASTHLFFHYSFCQTPLSACEHVPTRLRCQLLSSTSLYSHSHQT